MGRHRHTLHAKLHHIDLLSALYPPKSGSGGLATKGVLDSIRGLGFEKGSWIRKGSWMRKEVLDSKRDLGFEKRSWIRKGVLDSIRGLGFVKGSVGRLGVVCGSFVSFRGSCEGRLGVVFESSRSRLRGRLGLS